MLLVERGYVQNKTFANM